MDTWIEAPRNNEQEAILVSLCTNFQVRCPNCGREGEHLVGRETRRFEFWCSGCGLPLFVELK